MVVHGGEMSVPMLHVSMVMLMSLIGFKQRIKSIVLVTIDLFDCYRNDYRYNDYDGDY